jgi:MoxR-like ATPase
MPDVITILDGERANTDCPLDKGHMVVGSAPDCAVRLGGDGIAAQHAALECRASGWSARALDTTRPLIVEGKPVASLKLEHGTVFSVGGVRLRFRAARTSIEHTPGASRSANEAEVAVAHLQKARERILAQAERIVIGQRGVLDQILVALFANGHCLLVGAPGLAKTLMVRVLAGTLDLGNRRVQFTPDLMPADITGTDILEEDPATGARRFRFKQGPIFTNLLLADEINRTPPKTQAALLEAMQERRVTAGGATFDLPKPFFVLATQNPIEQEGTYPLPEAQLDRFMFCIHLGYPNAADEARILLETTRDLDWNVERVLSAEAILNFQHLVRSLPVSPHVAQYATELIRATRPGDPSAKGWVEQYVRWGAGTRAGQYLLLAAKSYALLSGRTSVSCADIRAFAVPVLRHRIACSFAAGSEGIDADAVVKRVLAAVKEPAYA